MAREVRREVYFIRMRTLYPELVPFNFFYYASKGELAVSRKGRLSYVGSGAMARFDTEWEAHEFLAGIKRKHNFEYEVTFYQEWVKS